MSEKSCKTIVVGILYSASEGFKICSNSTRLDFFSLSSFYRFSDHDSLEMSEIELKFIFGNFFCNRIAKGLKCVQIEL